MKHKIIMYLKHPKYILLFLDLKGIIRIPDRLYLKWMFEKRMHKKLDLKNPKTFNEKLQWLKIYDRKELYTTLVDKYKVKEYVSEKIGSKYVIPTLGVYEDFSQLDFDKLPNQFVMKCTHDSGGIAICKNKNSFSMKEARKKLEKNLKTNFYFLAREWPYKNVKPRIIIEKLIKDTNNEDILDYKFMCFNGKVKCCFVCSERHSEKGLAIDIFDTDWKRMSFKRKYRNSSIKIEKPKNYELMISLAEKLAKNISFVRMDFYEIEGKVYFGEFTFYPEGGFEKFEPEKYDEILGKWLSLEKVMQNEK